MKALFLLFIFMSSQTFASESDTVKIATCYIKDTHEEVLISTARSGTIEFLTFSSKDNPKMRHYISSTAPNLIKQNDEKLFIAKSGRRFEIIRKVGELVINKELKSGKFHLKQYGPFYDGAFATYDYELENCEFEQL